MTERKKEIIEIQLEPDEKEIENALPESLEKLPVTKNLAEELMIAKKAAANFLRKQT